MQTSIYYFTFGSDPKYPFQGGWVQVEAESLNQAAAIFRQHFPDRTPGVLNCADYYTSAQFYWTGMAEGGNRGERCHLRLDRHGIVEKGEENDAKKKERRGKRRT